MCWGTMIAARDWMDIGPMSAVVSHVPDRYPFQHGSTLISIAWAPVPRSIWAEKPPVRASTEFSAPIYEHSWQSASVAGDPPGIVGELWINGGWLAVLVGMPLLGAVLRQVERWNQLSAATQGLSSLVYGVFVVQLAPGSHPSMSPVF